MREHEKFSTRPITLLHYILLALVLAVVAYVRIRLLTVPLERDEGEYAYLGQLLLKGMPPYVAAYTMKLPGVGIAYALIMLLFGQTPAGIHIGLLIVNGICICLVYLLARRLLERDPAIISCASFAVLSLSQSVFGVFAHATHFVVMFSLSGFILLLRHLDRGKLAMLFFSGLSFGLAFTMKQHAILLITFAFLYLLWRGRDKFPAGKKHFTAGCVLFLLGTSIPYALLVIWLSKAGAFARFWFWTVQYAREYASGPSLPTGLFNLVMSLTRLRPEFPLWLLGVTGFALMFTSQKSRTDRPFVFGFLLFSFLAVCPGFYFREHYFVMMLPAVAILAGFACSCAGRLLSFWQPAIHVRYAPIFIITATIGSGLYLEKGYLFTLTPDEVSRTLGGTNPFPEALQVARYLKDHTSRTDRIAVLGSEPEIYFYADRLSATGYIYMYGLMENQPHAERMQQEMIREIELAGPKYVVTVNVATSWLIQPFSQRKILDWGNSYIKQAYEAVGVVEIADSGPSNYRWDAQAAGYSPVTDSSLIIYKRKEGV